MSDIIDKVLYEPEVQQVSRIDIKEAYEQVFKGKYAEIVIRDLINTTTYGSTGLPIEANAAYCLLGQRSVLQHIKDMLNTPITQEDQVEDEKMGNITDDIPDLLT